MLIAGLLLPSGEINWNCPCLGGMATGPCGVEFRDAFSCFHYSEAEPKGSDCYDNFKQMQDCMASYPTVYNQHLDDEKESAFPGMGLDDNDEDEEDVHDKYADSETDNKAEPQKAVSVKN
jgi:intermembrane space import and assembly protein 40